MTTVSFRFRRMAWARVLIVGLLCPSALRADDWPQWRGANRDGVWSEGGILEAFPAGGLEGRWSVPVGVGVSSPVVVQGGVYVTDAELVRSKARERVHCFEEATGKPRWSYAYDVNYPDWALESFDKGFLGPVATPIVRDGKVYALGFLGHLCCLDAAKGDVLWRKDLPKAYPAKELHCHASPLIEGDLLIVFVGAKPAATLIAFDRNTGQEVWKALDESATSSSPIMITAGGGRQLIVWTQESVTSLDPATGKTHWRQRLLTSADYVVSTPVCHKDLLLLGGLMMKLDPDKPAASVLWPATRAASRRILSHTSTALFRGDHLYSAKSFGELVCIEASTGKQVWETDKVTEVRNGASIHLTANGHCVFLYNERGELIRAQLTPEGYQELGRVALLEPTYAFGGRKVAWAPPAYANRRVFVRSDKELICASLAAQP
ncbi:MAG: PQQ-binding-like beta-propeller repeat protein [Planctomycetes bacterium]|nr:PQQ-binding-like beta-propeller repeat protein [Planctomycetota bacterium]